MYPFTTRRATFLISLSFVLAIGCSSGPSAETGKEPPKPPEPVSAQQAFYQMYAAARTWNQDIEAYQMQSIVAGGIAPADGKYPAWRLTFVSESSRAAKTYNYSIVTADGLNEGIFGGPEEGYSGPRGQNSPFPIAALKVDSTAAYETAMEHGADYAKKNPKMPITFLLEYVKQFRNPVWRVIWGESVSMSGFSIYVDATTGNYLQTMH